MSKSREHSEAEIRMGDQRLPQKERDRLIEEYQPYVEHVVGYLIRTKGLPKSLSDELLSAGYLGLVEAADRYDPRAAGAFKAFAFLRIRGAIIDNIRRNSEVTGRQYRAIKALQIADELREEVLHEEEASKNGSKRQQAAVRDKQTRLAELLEFASQCALAQRVEMNHVEVEASLNDPRGSTPEDAEIRRSERKLFLAIIEELPELEQLIVREHYQEDLDFNEICKRHPELSKSWVSKLHKRAVQKMKVAYLEKMQEESGNALA